VLRYLREAFWAGPVVRGLGRLPANALGVLGFALLGFADPGFWLLGLGLEAGYLALLSSHPRFQRWVDALARTSPAAAGSRREALVARLQPGARERLKRLDEKCARILEVYREAEAEEFEIDGNRTALHQLSWIYLKLLVARDQLQASKVHATGGDLRHRIAELEREAAGAGLSSSLRESREATLMILRQRLANLERCDETLIEVDSDLERVEAQIDLALENARLHGRSDLIPGKIELASQLLGDGLDFGEAAGAVVALEQEYGSRKADRDVQ
jgi:hypothetical protein